MIESAGFLVILSVFIYVVARAMEIHFLLRRNNNDGNDESKAGDGSSSRWNVNMHTVRCEPKVVTREALLVLVTVFLSVKMQQLMMMQGRGEPFMHSISSLMSSTGGMKLFSGSKDGLSQSTPVGRVPITRGEFPMHAQ